MGSVKAAAIGVKAITRIILTFKLEQCDVDVLFCALDTEAYSRLARDTRRRSRLTLVVPIWKFLACVIVCQGLGGHVRGVGRGFT